MFFFLLKSKGQQVSSGPQDSSKYSRLFQHHYSLDGLYSFSDLNFPQSFFQETVPRAPIIISSVTRRDLALIWKKKQKERRKEEYVDMKPPTMRKELQSLIGRLVWIRQFIETRLNESIRTDMFSNLMAPINELNKPGWTFVWTEGANKAFNKIKKRLASPPIISFPRLHRTLYPHHRRQRYHMWGHSHARE